MEDILLIDKPAGITSFGVIRELRKKLNIKKIGHAGTLDPLATGLMVLGFGPGTKKLTELTKLDKEYEAEILLGERRSTGDMDGEILEEKTVSEPVSEAVLKATVADMVGELTLPVSAYSAIKKNGVPMYKRARAAAKRGETVEDVPIRTMSVYEAEFLSASHQNGRQIVGVRFHVGSGTYIRSLAEEFGVRLGYPATLKRLRRTKVGEFDIKDARTLEEI